MKRTFFLALAFVAALLTGPMLTACGSTPGAIVAAPQGPNAKVAAALAVSTEVRELLTIAVKADKISATDAENLRMQINTARAGIDVAQGMLKTSPVDGDARLSAARATLDAVKTYLLTQGAK